MVKKIVTRAVETGEIRKDIDIQAVAEQYFSLSIGLASDIMRNRSVNAAIKSLKGQLHQLYYLLKK